MEWSTQPIAAVCSCAVLLAMNDCCCFGDRSALRSEGAYPVRFEFQRIPKYVIPPGQTRQVRLHIAFLPFALEAQKQRSHEMSITIQRSFPNFLQSWEDRLPRGVRKPPEILVRSKVWSFYPRGQVWWTALFTPIALPLGPLHDACLSFTSSSYYA